MSSSIINDGSDEELSERHHHTYQRLRIQSLIDQYGVVPPHKSTIHRLKACANKYYQSLSFVAVANAFLDSIPLIRCLKEYKIRKYLVGDILAGMTVAIMHIPQGIAYGVLAGLSPTNGLYVSFFPVLIYMVFGTCPHLSMGQFSQILIQMTLYNPNVQLFTSITLLCEFLSTGGVFPSTYFEPIDFYVFSSLLQLICTIIYMCFIIYFMVKEIRLFIELKSKYFKQFWSLIHLTIIGCSWGSIGVYIWRFHQSNHISQLFKQTNGYVFINLQISVSINNLLISLLTYASRLVLNN